MSTDATPAIPSFRKQANSSDGGDFEHPPSGTHPAVLVGILDLGTTDNTYKDKTTKRQKIMLVWELTAEADSNGQNFVLGQDYTWSLNEKAHLRKIVEGFRGKTLADNEDFDLMIMLGKPCMVNVSEGLSAGGKKFMEVTAMSPPMRGLTVPPPTHEPFVFHWGMIGSTHDPIEIPDWIPRVYGRPVIDDLKKTDEYAKLSPF